MRALHASQSAVSRVLIINLLNKKSRQFHLPVRKPGLLVGAAAIACGGCAAVHPHLAGRPWLGSHFIIVLDINAGHALGIRPRASAPQSVIFMRCGTQFAPQQKKKKKTALAITKMTNATTQTWRADCRCLVPALAAAPSRASKMARRPENPKQAGGRSPGECALQPWIWASHHRLAGSLIGPARSAISAVPYSDGDFRDQAQIFTTKRTDPSILS